MSKQLKKPEKSDNETEEQNGDCRYGCRPVMWYPKAERRPSEEDRNKETNNEFTFNRCPQPFMWNNSFFNCGCCCCFQPPPCCPCRMYPWQPMRYGPGPRNQLQKQDRKSTQTQSKNKGKKRDVPVREGMDERLEIDAMKDMELASIVINDARSNFSEAIKEEKCGVKDKKNQTGVPSSSSNRIMLTQTNDTWIVNKANEDFGKLAKQEKNKNENLKRGKKKNLVGFTQSTEDRGTAVSPKSRETDCISERNAPTDTWFINCADENFVKLANQEKIENFRRIKVTTERTTVQFEQGQDNENGTERIYPGNSTIDTTKPKEHFEKYVEDARAENQKLKEGSGKESEEYSSRRVKTSQQKETSKR